MSIKNFELANVSVCCILCKKEIKGLANFKRHSDSCVEKSRECKNENCETVVYHPSGKKLYCSPECYHDAFRKNKHRGVDKRPSYRTICFEYHEKKCIKCGEEEIVEVHHFDENNQNNSPENLIPLCPNHHRYIHMKKFKKEYQELVRKYLKEKDL